MAYDELIFRVHALQRMFERGISETDVRDVLEYGETIEAYPDDVPYPSRLILGFAVVGLCMCWPVMTLTLRPQ